MTIKTPVLDLVEFILPEGINWEDVNLEETFVLLDEHKTCLEASAKVVEDKGLIPVMVLTQKGFSVNQFCDIIPNITTKLVGDSGMFNAHKDCIQCNTVSEIREILSNTGVSAYFTPRAFDTVEACSLGILQLTKEVLAA